MPEQWSWDKYVEFITTVPAGKEDLEFFRAHPPSCARAYLQGTASSPPNYTPIPFMARAEKEDSTDSFFSRTIKSPATVPHLLVLIRKDILAPRSGNDTLETLIHGAAGGGRDAVDPFAQPHLAVLAHLGSDLNGFRDTVHGGVLASLVDETMGSCVEAFRQLVVQDREYLYTAKLEMSYRAPAVSPGVIMIKTRLVARQGRKWNLEAQVLDADGKVLVEAKALWIQARKGAAL
ncbi:hypothetical protein FQN53_007213 [Emmonsiellopsis sp. PD_33]|nr:hypothetical protein FQN53_007213 [Emmonsiellopsis sp. PD_33]KAK2791625.1 hypothetical protein FQN51_002174 [Onygenales sp. PD_10]